jgi:hypothetical protein
MSPRNTARILLATALLAGGAAVEAPAVSAWDVPAAAPVQRTSRLGGRAYLQRRTPVVGATVLVHRQDRPDELFLTSTDDRGIFRIDGLPDGSYRVRVEREGLGAQVKDDVTLKFPFRAVVELDLDPVGSNAAASTMIVPASGGADGPLTVHGGVSGVDGEPVGEISLRFVRLDGAEDPRVVRSLPDGTFQLEGVGSGVWRLEVSGVGFLSQRMAIGLEGQVDLSVIIVRQPAGYDPTPLELMPVEQPIPPPGFLEEEPAAGDSQPGR